MKKVVGQILASAMLPAFAPAAQAQNLDDIVRKVSPVGRRRADQGRDVG